eukprot:g42415.t1
MVHQFLLGTFQIILSLRDAYQISILIRKLLLHQSIMREKNAKRQPGLKNRQCPFTPPDFYHITDTGCLQFLEADSQQAEGMTDAGTAWWNKVFEGKIDDQKRVPMAAFLKELKAKFEGKVNVGNDKQWQMAILLLITNNPKAVSEDKFKAFVKRFGPFDDSLKKAHDNLYEKTGLPHKWFHSFLDRDAVKKVFEKAPIGAYLVRFSNGNPEDLVLSYMRTKDNKQSVKHIIIANCEGKGYAFKGESAQFASVEAIIKTWGGKGNRLCKPIESDAYKMMVQQSRQQQSQESAYSTWPEGDPVGGLVDSGGQPLLATIEMASCDQLSLHQNLPQSSETYIVSTAARDMHCSADRGPSTG